MSNIYGILFLENFFHKWKYQNEFYDDHKSVL